MPQIDPSHAADAAEPPDPLESARRVGLRYVRSRRRGIERRRAGEGFTYLDASGKSVTDAATLARIDSLVIPPAWEDVWICSSPKGHIQAVGRDARGRKQYRYHPLYREVRDLGKYDRLVDFARALPRIRRRVERDLRREGLPKRKVIAAVIRLLDETYLRIGNREYTRSNESFGLTTLLDDHVKFRGPKISFSFRGKSAQELEVHLESSRLARIVKRCRDLPGARLFQYRENGKVCSIDSGDVNDYLRAIGRQNFTAKDFRTWGGTKLAAEALSEMEPPSKAKKTQARRNIVAAIKQVAAHLGNKPATCRKYYIHQGVIEAYEQETLSLCLEGCEGTAGPKSVRGLRQLEVGVLRVLLTAAEASEAALEEAA